MSQHEETEDNVHSSETPLHGEHDSQTEAQSLERLRPDRPGLSKPVEKDRSDSEQQQRLACPVIHIGHVDSDSSEMSTANNDYPAHWRGRIRCRCSLVMSQGETEDDVHSSGTPLHGEHDSQTKAQSNGSNVSKSHMPQGDINNRPKRRSLRKRRSSESKDPSTSKTPCKPLNSRNLNLDSEDRVSPLRMSTQCGETSDSDASFKSDMSKEDDINFKERRSSLRCRLKCTASTGSNSNHSQGRIIAKQRHSSLKKSPMTSGEKCSSWTQRNRPRKLVV